MEIKPLDAPCSRRIAQPLRRCRRRRQACRTRAQIQLGRADGRLLHALCREGSGSVRAGQPRSAVLLLPVGRTATRRPQEREPGRGHDRPGHRLRSRTEHSAQADLLGSRSRRRRRPRREPEERHQQLYGHRQGQEHRRPVGHLRTGFAGAVGKESRHQVQHAQRAQYRTAAVRQRDGERFPRCRYLLDALCPDPDRSRLQGRQLGRRLRARWRRVSRHDRSAPQIPAGQPGDRFEAGGDSRQVDGGDRQEPRARHQRADEISVGDALGGQGRL